MGRTAQVRIQEACDDLYCDPDDAAVSRRLRLLLGRAPVASNGAGAHGDGVVSRASWRRLVKIACDELHDDPDDADARDRLLILLAAGDGGLAPAVA